MTRIEQLELWVEGKNVHNDEFGECCPDFACCQKENHFPIETRKKFMEAYKTGGSEACMPFLLMALSGVAGDSVYIAGMMDNGDQ